MDFLLQLIVFGLLSGAVFAAVALGFSLVFGVLNIVNFAHGAFVVIGAYVLYTLSNVLDVNPFLLIPASFISMGIFGYLLQRLLISRVMERSIPMVLLLTLGVILVLTESVKMIWGHDEIYVTAIMTGAESYTIGNIYLPKVSVYVFLITAIVTVLLFIFLNKTEMGRAIRACRDDKEIAKVMGIRVDQICCYTMAICGAWTGMAGAMIVMIENIFPEGGFSWVIVAFVVSIVGGLGSMPGVLLGGFVVGLVSSLSSGYLPPGWTHAILYSLIVFILIVKPTGLLGEKQK